MDQLIASQRRVTLDHHSDLKSLLGSVIEVNILDSNCSLLTVVIPNFGTSQSHCDLGLHGNGGDTCGRSGISDAIDRYSKMASSICFHRDHSKGGQVAVTSVGRFGQATNELQAIDIALARIDNFAPQQIAWVLRMSNEPTLFANTPLDPSEFASSDLHTQSVSNAWPQCSATGLNLEGELV